MMPHRAVCEARLTAAVQGLAAMLCVADARYQCEAQLAVTAKKFERIMCERRFLPQFLVASAEQSRKWVLCRMPHRYGVQSCVGAVNPFQKGRGVWFFEPVQQQNCLAQFGALCPDATLLRQPLLPAEGVAAGSVNLAAHLGQDGLPQQELLRKTVTDAVHLLDNAIDASDYDSLEQSRFTRGARRLCIGIMGLCQALQAAGLSYDSPQARQWAAGLMRQIACYAKEASQHLAQQRGAFALYQEIQQPCTMKPRRNISLTGIYPDAQLAALCGVTPGIQPRGGMLPEAYVQMQAAIQHEVDGCVYLPMMVQSREQMQQLCMKAYEMGCKSIDAVSNEMPTAQLPLCLCRPMQKEDDTMPLPDEHCVQTAATI